MIYYDVFNGDADGICALHQLRMAEPRDSLLVTGVKRDIDLLKKLTAVSEASVTVLDISLDKNREPLRGLLERGCTVLYVDHHYAGEIPVSPGLTAHIDPDSEVCTSIIVDRLLHGRYRPWAVVAAFGDNLVESANRCADTLALPVADRDKLRELGELMNYNGYGAVIGDLLLPPDELFRAINSYEDPLAFHARSAIMERLRQGYAADMAAARERPPAGRSPHGRVYRFPGEPWARRVAGVFINERAREAPELAHALLVDNGDSTHMVSVRAPLARKRGADTLCRQFATGGGRAAAAGINALPEEQVALFLKAFEENFTA